MITVKVGETCLGITLKNSTGAPYAEQVLTLADARQFAYNLVEACNQLDIKMRCTHGSDKDEWIPASGGTETPFFSRSGKHLLYCWNPVQKKHAYLDLGTDMILTDEEAQLALENV